MEEGTAVGSRGGGPGSTLLAGRLPGSGVGPGTPDPLQGAWGLRAGNTFRSGGSFGG